MTNDAVRHLAAFRVRKPGNEDYKSLPMTGEQESCRRTYMRQMLQKTQWADAQDDIVDNMRVWGEDANGFFVEDSSMCEFYIPEKRVDAQMAQFRRSRSMIPFEYMNLLLPSFDWRKYGYDTRETQKSFGALWSNLKNSDRKEWAFISTPRQRVVEKRCLQAFS